MAYEHREGQGSLFKNDKQNDRQPDFKGTILIKGVLYNISAWNRTSQNGREYISLQAEEKSAADLGRGRSGGYAPQVPPQTPPPPAVEPDDLPQFDETDLPF